MKKADEMLIESAEIYAERNKIYGDGYKTFGKLVKALFPDGVHLETEEDFTRWGVFQMMLSKIHRYSQNFTKGGHYDSLIDLSTYSAMMNELDGMIVPAPEKRISLCELKFCDMEFNAESAICKDCMAEARKS